MKTILILLALAPMALAQPAAHKRAQAADNTGRNAGQALTAEDQGGSAADRDLTSKIRRELMDEKSLSTNAKNVKVITTGGRVTLRGPVHSEEEKRKVAEAAEKVAGKGKVANELEVKKNH